jgi:hypothetical protein
VVILCLFCLKRCIMFVCLKGCVDVTLLDWRADQPSEVALGGYLHWLYIVFVCL